MVRALPCNRLQRWLLLIAAVVVLLAIGATAWTGGEARQVPPPAGYAFPALTGRVVDQAGMLPAADEKALDARLATLDHHTGHQFVIVTVDSLGGHAIEDYSLRLGRYWGIGRKTINDGILLVVAPHERKVRIEVGYGLEKTVTNAEAARIIDADILPSFRKGQMTTGIDRGADAIIADLSRGTT